MAIGDPYATTAELKAYARITDTDDDTAIATALLASSRAVDEFCGRQFNDAGATSTRAFRSTGCTRADVDDFHTTTGLVVKTAPSSDGTYATTLTAAEYTLSPLNGVVNGYPGYPYDTILLDRGDAFTSSYGQPEVQVTAQWGWAEVPAAVKQATLIMTARVFGRRNSPHGQPVVGAGDFVFRVSRDDPDMVNLLAPYQRVQFGIA
jgi:hypothetical protein